MIKLSQLNSIFSKKPVWDWLNSSVKNIGFRSATCKLRRMSPFFTKNKKNRVDPAQLDLQFTNTVFVSLADGGDCLLRLGWCIGMVTDWCIGMVTDSDLMERSWTVSLTGMPMHFVLTGMPMHFVYPLCVLHSSYPHLHSKIQGV